MLAADGFGWRFSMYSVTDPARGVLGEAVLLGEEPIDLKDGKAVITKGPIGALLGIMPWNFPCYQVARFVAPNLVLGNTILLKHASICPRSARAIEDGPRHARG